jgi:hypothetical protein
MKPNPLNTWLARVLELLGISSQPQPEVPTIEPEEVQERDAAKSEVADLDGQARKMLDDIRFYASWSGTDGERQLDQVKNALVTGYPGHDDKITQAIEQGKMLRGLCDRAYKAASSHGADSPQVKAVMKEVWKDCGWGAFQAKKQIKRGHAAFEKRRTTEQKNGTPRASLQPRTAAHLSSPLRMPSLAVRRSTAPVPAGLHGSDLRTQKPAANWTVVIDESGSEFGADATSFKPSKQGRFVAVVIPGQPLALPPLQKAWHAVDCTDDEEIDQVFQAVLSADAGVLGITVASLPVTPGERWADGVALLIDWILRLLPVDGHTEVAVQVENRGAFKRGDLWPLIERDCLRRLALSFPQAAGWIDLRIKVVGKDDSEVGGYADAIAYSWARTSPASNARIKESLLADTCLLESDARALLNAWDAFVQGVNLPGQLWWELLHETANLGSLTATLLDRIGIECQADTQRWAVYLDETRRRMAGAAVELARLADATAWLEHYHPADADIPPLMRLAWLIVKLARSNHYGDAESTWENEVAALAHALIDEAAPLVCHANLHLAVARTNRFDFDGASRCLERWQTQPVAVPGLRYWGQVRSSLGQHSALFGDQTAAVARFDEALAAFDRLSDPAVRDKEAAQTGAYRAIALMDLADATETEVRAAVETITGPIAKTIPSLAISGAPSCRYAHHLLLRWLVRHGSPEEQASYLKHRQEWKVGHGHPWPLIQLYRGFLLHAHETEAARQFAIGAAELAFSADQGPVVHLIGACCRVIAAAWGAPWPEADSEFHELEISLPSACERIAQLRQALQTPPPPLDLLSQILPFNFR